VAPATAARGVVDAIAEAARRLGVPHRLGVTQSKDSFYGEVEPGRMPMAGLLEDRWNAWVAGGAICSEMEASAIFIISAIHRVRAGGIMHMHVEGGDVERERQRMLETSVESLRVLIARDRAGEQWP
jgi:uridine phosphorylase